MSLPPDDPGKNELSDPTNNTTDDPGKTAPDDLSKNAPDDLSKNAPDDPVLVACRKGDLEHIKLLITSAEQTQEIFHCALVPKNEESNLHYYHNDLCGVEASTTL